MSCGWIQPHDSLDLRRLKKSLIDAYENGRYRGGIPQNHAPRELKGVVGPQWMTLNEFAGQIEHRIAHNLPQESCPQLEVESLEQIRGDLRFQVACPLTPTNGRVKLGLRQSQYGKPMGLRPSRHFEHALTTGFAHVQLD